MAAFFLIRLGDKRDRMYINIGTIMIPVYGLLIVTGAIIGFGAGIYLIKRNCLSVDEFIILVGYTCAGGFIGAKLLYLWVSRDDIQWNRLLEYEYFRQIMNGGFVFYGGLAGGFIALWCAHKIHHILAVKYLSVCIPVLPLVHGFGRIGCGLVGCCYGIPYDGMFAIKYHESAGAPLNISLFPIQYLEAGINFLIALILFCVVLKQGINICNIYLYVAIYSVMRFLLEFFRYDRNERGFWLGISTSQWISIALFLSVGLVWVLHLKRVRLRREKEIQNPTRTKSSSF